MLDGDGVGVGIEIRESLEFRDPRAINLVADGKLARFVVDIDNDVFAEVLERDFRAQTRAKVPNFVRPFLELGVVGNATLEREGLVFSPAG